jgi:hypothetical protein
VPVKYAILGLIAGILWLAGSAVVGYSSDSGPIAMLVAFAGGGYIGEWLRQRSGKTK